MNKEDDRDVTGVGKSDPAENRSRQKRARGGEGRGEKRDQSPEEILELSRSLRKRMQRILREDNANNQKGLPAIGKMESVEEISDILMNKGLQESLLDEGILNEIKGWLEPLPDKSMPNIKVKKRLLDVLKNMRIHKEHLVTSGVGKIVYFYTINPKEAKEIKSMAKTLVQKWTSEIFKPENDD
ncbi:uncharacterized protein Eint_080360 [Encephalitozoon intestinalis ATCC 50506]|uniref:TFIIS N-terminal domain-containing protein n=1 Tax=Encephalitozoon intestinalis (strain ATCC 50506) TaxID=876142 RepID=E0S8H8_ENCIT|nr:uncharacterized protein Eint_080360 [Encephalitozoon intestinalis ATCC 50506]ADM11972.1 hypothetical protein Eint_080360 [Encephalitozoon intestinalis ATCC 50506]UTX45757.1 transcription factor Iws1 [Encephalitozoon intestinalis]